MEANANLMPPSPSVTAPTSGPTGNGPKNSSNTGAINKTSNSVPALLPPPQASGRSSNRRSGQYSSVRASTAEPTAVFKDKVCFFEFQFF